MSKKIAATYFLDPGQKPVPPVFEQLELNMFEQEEKCLPDDYVVCTDYRAVELLRNAKVIGLDIETYSYIPSGALLFLTGGVRLVTVSFMTGQVVWWDSFDHSTTEPFWVLLKQRIAEGLTVVGHNLKFDIGFLSYHYDFVFRKTFDTMLASQVYWSGVGISKAKPGEDRSVRCRFSHSLQALAKRLLGMDIEKDLQKSDFSVPRLSQDQIAYACKDAAVTLQCGKRMNELIRSAGLTYSANAEFAALPAFAMMEVHGVPVNESILDQTIQIYKEQLEVVDSNIRTVIPKDVNYVSNVQLLKFFRKDLKEIIPSVDRESLMVLCKEKPKHRFLVEQILAYRFLANLLERMENVKSLTFRGTVRTSFRQIAPAGTGRSSCTGKLNSDLEFGVNTQTIPNLDGYWEGKIPNPRKVFQAPPGFKIIIYDLSQAHNRIACEMSRDPRLIRIYQNKEDAHTLLGYELAKMEGWDISLAEFAERVKKAKKGSQDPLDLRAKRKREEGKVGNYSQLNQGGVQTVKSNMQANGIFVTDQQVKNIQESWRRLYRTLYNFIKSSIAKANTASFNFGKEDPSLAKEQYGVIYGLTGRRQFLLKEFENKVNYTDAISYMWLSSEADMVKEAIGECYLKFLDTPHWQAHIFNMSHDEINVLCSEQHSLEVVGYVKNTFETILKKWIQSIPVSDENPLESFLCESLADK